MRLPVLLSRPVECYSDTADKDQSSESRGGGAMNSLIADSLLVALLPSKILDKISRRSTMLKKKLLRQD